MGAREEPGQGRVEAPVAGTPPAVRLPNIRQRLKLNPELCPPVIVPGDAALEVKAPAAADEVLEAPEAEAEEDLPPVAPDPRDVERREPTITEVRAPARPGVPALHDAEAGKVAIRVPGGRAVPPPPEPAPAPPPAVRRGDREERTVQSLLRGAVLNHAGVQMALLGLAGVLIVVVWSALDGRPASPGAAPRPRAPEADMRPFPKLEVRGADRVTEDDVEALLKRRKGTPAAEAPALSSARATPTGAGTIIPKPGQQLEDSDMPPITDRRAAASGGGGRPARGGVGRRATDGRFFAPGGLLKTPTKAGGDEGQLGLKVGDRFKVRLEVGVVSSAHEDVLASLVEDVVRDGRRILRKGDILRGQASSMDKRILVRFRSVESGGHPLSMSGYAVDGQMPGIVAHRREATVEERSRGQAASNAIAGAAEEAGEILAGATAVGRIAGRVASGAASEAQRAAQPDRSWVLEVPAGRTFEVVITEAAK